MRDVGGVRAGRELCCPPGAHCNHASPTNSSSPAAAVVSGSPASASSTLIHFSFISSSSVQPLRDANVEVSSSQHLFTIIIIIIIIINIIIIIIMNTDIMNERKLLSMYFFLLFILFFFCLNFGRSEWFYYLLYL